MLDPAAQPRAAPLVGRPYRADVKGLAMLPAKVSALSAPPE